MYFDNPFDEHFFLSEEDKLIKRIINEAGNINKDYVEPIIDTKLLNDDELINKYGNIGAKFLRIIEPCKPHHNYLYNSIILKNKKQSYVFFNMNKNTNKISFIVNEGILTNEIMDNIINITELTTILSNVMSDILGFNIQCTDIYKK